MVDRRLVGVWLTFSFIHTHVKALLLQEVDDEDVAALLADVKEEEALDLF